MEISSLEKILLGISSLVPITESIFFKNSVPSTNAERILGTKEAIINLPMITPYLGDFPETFVISAISGIFANYLEDLGKNKKSILIEKIGKYLPEITTYSITTYFTLGETILPQILPGTPDIKDIPAVLISSLAGYTISKITQQNNIYSKLKKSMN